MHDGEKPTVHSGGTLTMSIGRTKTVGVVALGRWWQSNWKLSPLAYATSTDFQLIFQQVTWTINGTSVKWISEARSTKDTLNHPHLYNSKQDVVGGVTLSQPARGQTHERTNQQLKPNYKPRGHIKSTKGIPRASNSGDQGDCTAESDRSPTTEGCTRKTGSQRRSI